MTTESATSGEEVAAVFDPGERNRDEHLWGDRLIVNVGNVVSWLFPALVVAIVAQVFLRQAGFNQAWLDDLQWWMYGFASLVGFTYAITTNSHVRVDIFHNHFSAKGKARVELFAVGWLLLPFLVLMTDVLVHYAVSSWTAREGSDSPNGLHRLYLLKISLPAVFFVSLIASWMVIKRNLATLGKPTLLGTTIAALPAIWFGLERVFHYAMWWGIRLTSPDVNPRRISRDPLLEYASTCAFAALVILIAVGFVLRHRSMRGA